MSEIKKEIKQNADGSYTITDAHSTADIVRWLLTQDSRETILYLLKEQRTWVGLTDEESWKIYGITGLGNGMAARFANAIEAKLREKNGF